jgi:putative ABC transport system permease protein
MLKNYFKIAIRNLVKNKMFSAINIFGLAIGIASCLLITLYVVDELDYDKFHENGSRIYRLNNDILYGGKDMRMAQTPDILAPVLKKDYPQVENYVRLYNAGPYLIKKPSEANFIREERILFADSTIFEVFTFPLVAGNPKTVLNEPTVIVISESAAKRHFGTENPIGKILNLDNKKDYKITGVMKDIPANSHIKADFFISMKSLNYDWGSFLSNNHWSYILLKEGTDPKSFDAKFEQVIANYVDPQIKKVLGSSIAELKKDGSTFKFWMIPLTDIHLKSAQSQELSANGNIEYVYIFSIIALFVLLIACINFMNLSTARASQRAKEVGVRKVMGSVRGQLMMQFFAECVLISFLALFLGLILVVFLLPFFNDISAKSLNINNLLNLKIIAIITIMPLIVGILAGSYPAIFLSSFQPIQVLKGRFALKGGSLRNGLVVFQFASSIVLITGTIIIYRQINFIKNKSLGYNKEQILVINDAYALDKQAVSFKDEVLKINGIKNGTLSGYLPTPSNRSSGSKWAEGHFDMNQGVMTENWEVDYDYLTTFDMKLAQGRNFSKEFGSDSMGVILNETAAKNFGFGKNAVNKGILALKGNFGNETLTYRVVGVVKDFHFESMKSKIGAICMFLRTSSGNVSFKLDKNAQMASTIKQIEQKWAQMAPGQPFTYEFMDDSFNNTYKNEQRIGKISLAFAILTILVACLGLFGLVTFVAEQRIKEIGIRKVLGASIASILQLLSKDFLKSIIISIILATPIAYYFMQKWLQDFEYRVNIEWWVFVATDFISIIIALFTVSYQAIKAAIMNPVKSLKTE